MEEEEAAGEDRREVRETTSRMVPRDLPRMEFPYGIEWEGVCGMGIGAGTGDGKTV